MKDQNVIDDRLFAVCLGKNGGKFTMGGYDDTIKANHEESIVWFPLQRPFDNYRITLDKIMIGSKHSNI